MSKFFKFRENNSPGELYEILCRAMEDTMSVCIASSSALVVTDLTAKIKADRMKQYIDNSHGAINAIGKIRSWLLKLSRHLDDKQIDFLDAIAPTKQIMSQFMAGNCEHQSFYLAALLRQQSVPAIVYNIEDIGHSVVIANNFLLDPWAGMMFSLDATDLCEFYGSSLNLKASWLNRLLSNKRFSYPDTLCPQTLDNLCNFDSHTSMRGA